MKRTRRFVCAALAAMMFVVCLPLTALAGDTPSDVKYAALTWDDGPNSYITPKLLDALAERNVKCTFFLSGTNANRNQELVKRIFTEGHQVANHTWSHYALSTKSDDIIHSEIENTRALLESITGKKEFMVRLPYGDGMSNQRVLRQAGAAVIGWAVDSSKGSKDNSEAGLYSGIVSNTADGSIILLHDSGSANMNAGLRAIDTLSKRGFSFVTVDELFRIKGVVPAVNTVYSRVRFAGTDYNENALSEHWAWPFLDRLNKLEILRGDGKGTKPNEYLSRAMAVTWLWYACGKPDADGGNGSTFKDVPAGVWYSAAACWGRREGIVSGTSDGGFHPTDTINREQFCVMLIKLAHKRGLVIPAAAAKKTYSDSFRVSAWAGATLRELWGSGFRSKNEMSVFRPSDSITRAEAAEFVCWYLDLKS